MWLSTSMAGGFASVRRAERVAQRVYVAVLQALHRAQAFEPVGRDLDRARQRFEERYAKAPVPFRGR
jgi:hypothetical protein